MANTPVENIDLLVQYAKALTQCLDELAKNECADADIQTSAAMLLITAGYDEQTIVNVIHGIGDDIVNSFRKNFYQGKQVAAVCALAAAVSAGIEELKTRKLVD